MKTIKNLLGGLLLVIILIILDREVWEEKPVSKKSNAYVWALISFLALALLGLMNKCVLAQEFVSTGNTTVVQWPFLSPSPLGMASANTTCTLDNKPVILVHPSIIQGSAEWRVIVSHEMVHVRQMRAVKGGCKKAVEKFRSSSEYRLMAEGEAYCTGFLGVTNTVYYEKLPYLMKALRELYANDMTLEQVTKLLTDPCFIWSGRHDAPP